MISIIIPTLNEEQRIGGVLDQLLAEPGDKEVLVVDGGSRDRTVDIARAKTGVQVSFARRGRAWQMNRGAELAQGNVILFLHADTTLQSGWHRQVQQAMADDNLLLGAFRFKVADPAPGFRLIEWGVRLRCRFRNLPYGDQALFMRRSDFLAMDGFLPIPFLEDVDLVHRCRDRGNVHVLSHTATSSARSWHRYGALRQTWRNWVAYYRYTHGTSVYDLYRAYYGPRRAIVLFCKWPEPGAVKTRLAATVGDERAVAVYRSLVYSTLASVRLSRSGADCWIYFAPRDAEQAFEDWFNGTFQYAPQSDGDLGARMLDAFEQSKREGYDEVLIIGTDCPGVRGLHIDQTFAALAENDLVLGPTEDGGYYLIGAREAQPDLFRDMTWSVESVYDETRKRVDRLGLTCATLETLRDVDTEEDVRALVEQR